MIFKGRRYTKCPRIVILPNRDDAGNLLPHVKGDTENCAYFGRAVMKGTEAEHPAAIKTKYQWESESEPVFAIPVEHKGHSRTDLMYGADGYMYLAYNGACYRAKIAKVQAA